MNVTRQAQEVLQVQTRGRGFYDVTSEVADWVGGTGIRTGLLTLFLRHTSASLTIQENADPTVLVDLERFFAELVPEGGGRYRHSTEGADDMPAHIRSALTQVHLTIPVENGRMCLGTWQGIYVFEHRARPHSRRLVLQVLGR